MGVGVISMQRNSITTLSHNMHGDAVTAPDHQVGFGSHDAHRASMIVSGANLGYRVTQGTDRFAFCLTRRREASAISAARLSSHLPCGADGLLRQVGNLMPARELNLNSGTSNSINELQASVLAWI